MTKTLKAGLYTLAIFGNTSSLSLAACSPTCISTVNCICGSSGKEDKLSGTNGPDWMYGYGLNDTLDAKGGDDALYGGSGDDILKAGSAAEYNTCDGSSGSDTADPASACDTTPGINVFK